MIFHINPRSFFDLLTYACGISHLVTRYYGRRAVVMENPSYADSRGGQVQKQRLPYASRRENEYEYRSGGVRKDSLAGGAGVEG